jgi:hypothetical protein
MNDSETAEESEHKTIDKERVSLSLVPKSKLIELISKLEALYPKIVR